MRHVHFIGIGGIGVSGIAQLVLKQGGRVTGSDLKESAITQKLIAQGARIFIGHRAENICGADLVVFSSAVRPDNPEMVAAREAGVPVKKRAEFLSDLMKDKTVITIAGAHGKTTTSSLAAKLLMAAGLHPTIAVGGILREDGDNAKLGESSYFVAEADESDGTFLCYSPTYSIITNIDCEHMDHYKSYDRLLAAFAAFVRQTREGGCVFYCREDEVLTDIVAGSGVASVSYGFGEGADFRAADLSLSQGRLKFTCVKAGQELGQVSLGLMGRHNALNALAVVALGDRLGLDFGRIASALSAFRGVERRFQVKYEDKGILVVDDYGHHPAEIAATIEAARLCQKSRVIVVFQPHRYSRTQLLMDRFAKSFLKSDYLLVTDVYAAGETPLPGADATTLVSRIRPETAAPVEYVAKEQIVGRLKGIVRANDLVLFLGAGDITKVCDEFAHDLQA